MVWKLDKLGRSLRDLIDLVSESKERGVEFVGLQDGINTATATGRFTFNIFVSLAEFEREINSLPFPLTPLLLWLFSFAAYKHQLN